MIWGAPDLLHLLWLLPFLAFLMVRAHRKRRAAAERFADPVMAERIAPLPPASRALLKGSLLLLGLGLLIVAAARPRFGVYFEQVSARGVDLVVCLDVSRSMLAEDVAPNRLERAKSDIRDLMERLQGDRLGLVAFAGKAVTVCPLTTDQGFFGSVLRDVSPQSAPRGGSLIGDAVRQALAVLPEVGNRDQAIVLITDGEDQDSLPLDAADWAAARQVKIFTVGLGDSKEGGRIPLSSRTGETTYLMHEGQVVWSRLDEEVLKEMALRTGGAYIAAGTRAYDLGQVYDDHLAELTAGEYSAEKRKRYKERFQVFLWLGLTALALEMLLRERPAKEPWQAAWEGGA